MQLADTGDLKSFEHWFIRVRVPSPALRRLLSWEPRKAFGSPKIPRWSRLLNNSQWKNIQKWNILCELEETTKPASKWKAYKIVYISSGDGIGIHAWFKITFRKDCGFESHSEHSTLLAQWWEHPAHNRTAFGSNPKQCICCFLQYIGPSPSGKAEGFDPSIRWFEPNWLCFKKQKLDARFRFCFFAFCLIHFPTCVE